MPTPQEELQKIFDEAEKFLKDKIWLRDYGEHLEPRPKGEKPREASESFKQMVQPQLEEGMNMRKEKIVEEIKKLPVEEREKAHVKLKNMMSTAGMPMDKLKEQEKQLPANEDVTQERRDKQKSRFVFMDEYPKSVEDKSIGKEDRHREPEPEQDKEPERD